MSTHIEMPEMGEGVIEGHIAAWLKQEGEKVAEFEPLLEVETDKVTTEIVAEQAGVLLEILVPAGETVAVGTPLAVIGDTSGATIVEPKSPPAQVAPWATPAPVAKSGLEHKPYTRQTALGWVSPVVGRMAAEHDLDLTQIVGTGRNGRITKRDVMAYLESQPTTPAETVVVAVPPTPAVPAPRTAMTQPLEALDGSVTPLTNMRRAIAEHMVHSKRTSPHVTTFFEFDFSAVAAHRAAHKGQFAQDGTKLTYMPYIVMATVQALKNHPLVNGQWTDEGILLKEEINIGMATAVPAGLIVPVIRQADNLNLLGLARAINDLANRARTNKLQAHEVQGGTFTITNHGASGSLLGTPIINQPQVGILGVGLIEKRVKVVGEAIAIRPCAYVSFSFDHRILDGATADAFVMTIKQVIENWPSSG